MVAALKFARLTLVTLGTTFFTCLYGVAHDLVTAHTCIEYFSVAHPMVIESLHDDPWACGIIWGILATWWLGLLVGLAAAVILAIRRQAEFSVVDFFKSLVRLLVLNAVVAIGAGGVGFFLGTQGLVRLPEHLRYPLTGQKLSPSLTGPFFFDVFAHSSSYLVGLGLAFLFLRRLWQSPLQPVEPQKEQSHP